MTHPFHEWLSKHLQDAEVEYKRIQALDDENEEHRELYEQVHQMWGYVAALEKCLKEFDALEKPGSPSRKKKHN